MNEETQIEEKAIGGWLILMSIGIIISPFRIGILMFTIFPEIFTSGSWEDITTPGSEAYNPFWGPIIIGEILFNSILIVASIYMAYKFFTKSKDFPKWYIGIALFSTIFIILDAYAIKLVLPDEPVFDADTTKELMRSMFMLFVWGSYLLLSKRVKETFVK